MKKIIMLSTAEYAADIVNASKSEEEIPPNYLKIVQDFNSGEVKEIGGSTYSIVKN